MSVHQFSTQNFHIVNGNPPSLNINYAGNVLVFFKLQGCKGCASFEPIFNQLSREDGRVAFAMLDITYNRDIIQLSRATSTPIQKVPHLILYVQGRPHARFRSEDKSIDSIRQFISGAIRAIPQQQQHMPQQQPAFVQQQPQQNMYGGAQGQAQYMPDARAPAQATRIAQQSSVAPAAHPSMQQQCDPDDEECLKIPQHIIPHNMPWSGDYKKLTGQL